MWPEHLSARLQDLILAEAGIEDFLQELAAAAAAGASGALGFAVHCDVRLARNRRPDVVASSAAAPAGKGPAPARTGAGDAGLGSRISLPLALDGGSTASLTFFAAEPGVFAGEASLACTQLAARAGQLTRIAVRLEAVQSLNHDLLEAMKSRTVINLASGILMAQSRSSQAEAFELLTRVSNNRNVKLRSVAEEILLRFESKPSSTAFTGGELGAADPAPA